MTREHAFTALFPFGGLGAGARGFLDAHVSLFERAARFECLGGIDFDPRACADFEYLTGSPAWCTDVLAITPSELRERYGERAPDVVFASPPCKGSSRLLSAAKARTAKYEAMNRLALEWTRRMLDAWPEPPALVLLENVPGLPTRAASMLRDLRKMLRAAGYVFHASTHDCGELGGLAQHRVRYLLVARHPGRCAPLLYQPPKRRVRGIGEVLSELPMPATQAAGTWGELHTMPRLSWRNWLRLALIPAGGDWRDLAGVLEGRARREVFRRHAVADWQQPIDAVTGPGGHSVEAVADPRLAMRDRPGNWSTYGVNAWDAPSGTVAGESAPSNGAYSVADPRVLESLPVPVGFDAAYGVLGWDEPARTIAGKASAGTGAYAVADPRDRGFVEGVRFLSLDEAMGLDLAPEKPPPFVPVIVAGDGTWHRPLTLLELATLQGLPAHVNGEPLRLTGTRTQIAEHVGNAVPVGAARAIAERMLVALVESAAGSWSLSSGGAVWVERGTEARLDG